MRKVFCEDCGDKLTYDSKEKEWLCDRCYIEKMEMKNDRT